MADSQFKLTNSVTTVLGMLNQFHSFSSLSYQPNTETTINSKYNLNKDVIPSVVPILKYFGIGIKGFKNTDDETGAQAYRPKASNMDLYIPVPIRCVPVENDLTSTERQKYRMRIRQTFNGNDYFCYYLKMLTFPNGKVDMIQETPDGVTSNYALNPANLTPTPPALDTGTIINSNRVIVSVTGQVDLTGAEVLEAIDVIYAGDLSKARISELGFYTGEDRWVDGNEILTGTNSGTNREAIYVQLAKHACSLGVDLSQAGNTLSSKVKFAHNACAYV